MAEQAAAPRDHIAWLLRTTNHMVRCQSVSALLDLAYDAIHDGLDYDRIGLLLADHTRPVLVQHLGTDRHGQKFYASDRESPLDADSFHGRLLADPRMGAAGPGFIFLDDATRQLPPKVRPYLDGEPHENVQVALRTAERVLGLISVDNLTSGRPITMTDIAPLVAFANALATALENVTLLEQRAQHIDALNDSLRRRVAELEWLREISRRVNDARTLDGVLDVVYDGIRDGLGYDRVGIQLFDHTNGVFEEHRGTDAQGHKMCPTDRAFTLAPDALIWQFPGIAALLRGADFYYTADAVTATHPDLRYLLDGEPRETLAIPLHSGERVAGMISVDNLLSGRPIAPNDAGPLLALANQVSTALANARLHERERAERLRLEVLLQSARALNSTLDRDQILRALAAHLVTALDAANVVFTILDFATRACKVLAHHTAPGCRPLFTEEDIWEPIAQYPVFEQMLQTHTPFIGRRDDPALHPVERAYLDEHDLYAEVLLPVVVCDEAASALEVYWDHAATISPDTIALCTAIAEQAAVALENARLYADAATRATCDALTGLLNHRTLLDTLDAVVAAAEPSALLLLDVDNFKLFNDTYGHLTGDAVLTRVAATLREVCRERDVAGRYGGDEFAVVLRGATAAEAATVAHRLADAVRTRPYVSPESAIIPLSVSIGLACFPADGRTRQELLAVADNAMYAAKRRAGASAITMDGAPSPGRIKSQARDAADLLGDSPFGVLEGLVNAVDAKDRYTREHSEHVTRLALLLAEALGLDAAQQRVLALAGPLHDVGKIAVPDRILRKPGRLSEAEYAAIKQHVTYGVAIIRGVLDDSGVLDAVAYHHERWDGQGYPHGLSGPRTPLLGRVMQIADAVSAMMLDRPYRQGLPWNRVVAELRAGAGRQFDPELVEPFIAAAGATRLDAAS